MRKIWRVAATEYLNSVRSKAFILGVLELTVLICVRARCRSFRKMSLPPRRPDGR